MCRPFLSRSISRPILYNTHCPTSLLHNSLFFGSHAGAKRGCIFYSLACSCREMGINFFDYLSDVLNRTAAMPPGSKPEAYRNLLPDKWTKE